MKPLVALCATRSWTSVRGKSTFTQREFEFTMVCVLPHTLATGENELGGPGTTRMYLIVRSTGISRTTGGAISLPGQ